MVVLLLSKFNTQISKIILQVMSRLWKYACKDYWINLVSDCKVYIKISQTITDWLTSRPTDWQRCDNSRFSGVPDWYRNDYCRVLALVWLTTQCVPSRQKRINNSWGKHKNHKLVVSLYVILEISLDLHKL